MKHITYVLCSIFSLGTLQSQNNFNPVQAFTKVPVADLVGSSFGMAHTTKEVFTYYNNLPLSGQSPRDCYRMHQLVFNEKVTILEQQGDEVLVQVPTVFYELEHSTLRNDTYWSLKKNFITCEELKNLNIPDDCFPQPIDYKDLHQHNSKKTVVLLFPFHDSGTNQFFSVGTRFVVDTKKKIRNAYAVFVFDPHKNCIKTSSIPLHLCRIENRAETIQKKIAHFVTVLKNWASDTTIIPYVWGGCSFTTRYTDDLFELVEKSELGKKYGYYKRKSCNGIPKTGFDCTGLVARAAQICGLPYYFKNSTTVLKYLQPITATQTCNEGDLIWIPGHIMVVADIKKNTIIEARAYDHGFGKIQEIALADVFQGITNFEQLHEAFKKGQSLHRLNKEKKVVQIIDTYKMLKLESLLKSKIH